MASKAETFGMVAIESMAFGIPVIASNAGGSPEILDFGKFGLLFESLNAESLANQMNHFSTYPNQFTKEALRAEAQKYDHSSVCEEVEKALSIIAPSLEVKTT
jgi:glycosyltransferase involved in cell wall biosynthesis